MCRQGADGGAGRPVMSMGAIRQSRLTAKSEAGEVSAAPEMVAPHFGRKGGGLVTFLATAIAI